VNELTTASSHSSRALRRRSFAAMLFESLGREVALTVLELQPGERVLEIGLGRGETLLKMATLVGARGRAAAIDGSAARLGLAQARLREVGYTNFALARGGPTDLPFPARAFDAAYCAFRLNGLGDDAVARVLFELLRVLRPGGRAVFAVFTHGERRVARALTRSWSALHRAAPRLLAGYRPRDLRAPVEKAGFEIDRRLYVEQRGVPSEVLLARRAARLGLME
jgi:ubiquinone/menaquinone biosynthesis C-methylase UbiE